MSGLILKLRPREELMINGVILENGDRNARLRIKTEGANILRMRDALKPEEATTPLKQAYYVAHLAVAGQISKVQAAETLNHAIACFAESDLQDVIAERLEQKDFYQIMKSLREAVFAETDRLSHRKTAAS